MAKQKKYYDLIMWFLGWLFNFISSLRAVASELAVPFEAFEHLGTSKGLETLREVLQLIKDRWIASQEVQLLIFPVYLDGQPLPQEEEIEKCFEHRIHWAICREEWKFHPSRHKALPPGEYEAIIRFSRRDRQPLEELIREGLQEGDLPATHIDGVPFAKQHPDVQRRYYLRLPGSWCDYGGGKQIAALGEDGGETTFETNDAEPTKSGDEFISKGSAFLFIRPKR